MNKIHFDNITDYHKHLSKPVPAHPQFSVSTVKSNAAQFGAECAATNTIISTSFYAISLKNVISGELFYGKTKYDCSSGTMLFFAPGQEFHTKGMKIESEGKVILFHEDFVRTHGIYDQIKSSSFFNYAANEALHLSSAEQRRMQKVFDGIEAEYHANYDEFSREIILSQIGVLLTYADRFYHRQFLLRKESDASIYTQFLHAFDECFDGAFDCVGHQSIPAITDIAARLNMTSRYLSDALKVETGKSAKESIQLLLVDKAKNALLSSGDSVATIAYSLGFEYPQYFARLFKKKVGLTPTQYRNQTH
ncbi:AraC family transcriptional regulator [Vibrio tapetis subsp. quintayensis]|uniref:helix-turn-helix domain-containing protein n=1 Tax=Vibrio tapetis TaxID=52443 RepID=UPI0025B48CF1|nr:helix-turn-helix domain-containing protein [Vibrio tapetis]MDN3680541.1 AraC family transcriptional regulator [Vibrio tapetis subsp. quintayensis]